MTAITGLNSSVNFKGDQEQQRSGGILFPVVGGAVAGTIVGGGIRGFKKPNLEGVSADTFQKTMDGVADLTEDQKSAVKTIKEHLAGKTSEEKTDAKPEKADAEAGTKAEGKGGTKAAKPSVAAGGITAEDLFKNAEDMDPMKYLQEKYGYRTVEDLMKGLRDDRIALGQESKGLRSAIKKGKNGQTRSDKVFGKVEQYIKQTTSINELDLRIQEEELKVSDMPTTNKAEQSARDIAQRRVETMKKNLQTQQENLAGFEAELKDNTAYQELKKSYEKEIEGLTPKEVVQTAEKTKKEKAEAKAKAEAEAKAPKAEAGTEAPKAEAPKTPEEMAKEAEAKAYADFSTTTDNAATNAGQRAKKEITEKIKTDAGKKAESSKEIKGLKGQARKDFIIKAQNEAVEANKERIEKYVQLQKQKEILKRLQAERTDRLKSLRRDGSLGAKKEAISNQRQLGQLEATVLEKEKDLEMIRDAKKNGKKITKTQAQANMDLAAAKAKDGIAKVAKEAGEKAKAGSEPKGVTAGIEDALKTLKDKLPKEFKKLNTKALAWGAGIGIAGGLILKWMFGGKSEPEA